MQEYVEMNVTFNDCDKQKTKEAMKESLLRILRLQSDDKEAVVKIEWHIDGIRHTEFTNLY